MKRIPTPKFRGPQIRTPQFINNLYRDMRDRRLLLPALALLVALIAVPAMLKSSSSSSPPPPQVSAGSGEPTAAQPAVVARQLGVTNYRKRLAALQSKNPFRKHFTSLPESAKLNTSSALDTSSSSASTSSATTPTEPSSSAGSSTTSSSGSISPSGSTSASTTHTKPKPFYVKRRIDVEVGPQGAVVKKRGVKQLSFLPSGAKPVVVYLGANEAGTRAYFDVSSDVTSASGDGRCLPSPSACNFVALKRGEVETFDYSPDPGTPYRLKLLAIRNVVSTSLGGRKPKPKRSAGTDAYGDARGSFTPFD